MQFYLKKNRMQVITHIYYNEIDTQGAKEVGLEIQSHSGATDDFSVMKSPCCMYDVSYRWLYSTISNIGYTDLSLMSA